jgi:NTP pyrophosphatase (non-canonical NTP hydrolase)
MSQQEYTLNEFQAQCATTAIYSEKIAELILPIENYMSVSFHKEGNNTEQERQAWAALEKIEKLLNLSYVVLGLAGEAGEVANKMKKVIRDGTTFEPLNKEVQGTNWYVNACLTELGVPANDAAVQLAETLQSRKERGVIQGNGDNR